MSKKSVYTSRLKKHIYSVFFLVTIIFSVICTLAVWQQQKSSVKTVAVNMLEQMKVICQKYDDYALGITTKDLQANINKANILRDYEMDIQDNFDLREAARNQYLSGVIILDADLKPVRSVNLDESDGTALLEKIRKDQQIQEIMRYPQKVFADRVTIKDRSYEYAIAARKENSGVLICYSDITELQNDKYELSLGNLLESSLQDEGEIVVVTDGETVLSSSDQSLNGLAVSECPITDVVTDDANSEDSDLIELKNNGKIWYGKHDIYRDYYLYIFFRSDIMYQEVVKQVSIALGIYIIIFMMAVLVRQQQKKNKMQQMEKEYHLINAIASIYKVNLLIHLRENTWEVILDTPKIREVTKEIVDADKMLDAIARKLVKSVSRESFLSFCDTSSIVERLQGKSFLVDTFETASGNWYQALLVPQMYENEKNLNTVMLLIRNVSDQKRKELEYQEQLREAAEQAAIANASKTDFLRRMSHDMRTPMNGIRGMTDICMEQCEDTKKVKECLSKIRTSSDFLLERINNVLDMSKIEAGKTEKERKPFDLKEVYNDAAMIISIQAKEAGIDFQKYEAVGEHWHLLGSPLNVQRIFQNIMSNAVKYNRPEGSVKVSLRETSATQDTASFVFVCKDTGIGMSREFQQRAFDIFEQEHVTARTVYRGCGLGLPIVKKTVELMGGTIELESEEGQGTTFVVKFSLKTDPDYKPEIQKPDQEAEEKKLQGIRILVAEDNNLNLEIESYMLTEEGAEVTEAGNGKEALDLFAESAPGTYDVILMDIMMPVMNGLEAAKAIRSLNHPDALSVPIIAVSANAFSDDIEASKASGMNAHLSKPINFAEAAEVINKYCNKKR